MFSETYLCVNLLGHRSKLYASMHLSVKLQGEAWQRWGFDLA